MRNYVCDVCKEPLGDDEQFSHVCPRLIPVEEKMQVIEAEVTGELRPQVEKIRRFDTGATRDTDKNKLTYSAFFSPAVLARRAEYMHKHRVQADGSLRPGNNWQKGIPQPVYMDSLMRHFMDVWMENEGIKTEAGLEEAICAAMFNLEGMLYEVLKRKQ